MHASQRLELVVIVGDAFKDALPHLAHIRKSLQRGQQRLAMEPESCRTCGFVFQKRERLRKPGRCPSCHHSFLEEPVFRIQASGEASRSEKEHGMQELRAVVSEDEFVALEHLAQDLGVSLEELVRRSLAAYVAQAKAEPAFESIGFGMWADRPEMQDAAKWVTELRHREWTR
jgi:predicted Zn-ribbon and HTH transcriptional regulator